MISKTLPEWWGIYTLGLRNDGQVYQKADMFPPNLKRLNLATILETCMGPNFFSGLSLRSITLLEKTLPGLKEYDSIEFVIERANQVLGLCKLQKYFSHLAENRDENAKTLTVLTNIPESDYEDLAMLTQEFIRKIGRKGSLDQLVLLLYPMIRRSNELFAWEVFLQRWEDLSELKELVHWIREFSIREEDREWLIFFASKIPNMAYLRAVKEIVRQDPAEAGRFLSLIEGQETIDLLMPEFFLQVKREERERLVGIVKRFFPARSSYGLKEILGLLSLQQIVRYEEELSPILSAPDWSTLSRVDQIKRLLQNSAIREGSKTYMQSLLVIHKEDEEKFAYIQSLAKSMYKSMVKIQQWYQISDDHPLVQTIIRHYETTLGIEEGPKHPVRVYKRILAINQNRCPVRLPFHEVSQLEERVRWNLQKIQAFYRRELERKSLTNAEFYAWFKKDPRVFWGQFLEEVEREWPTTEIAQLHIRRFKEKALDPDVVGDETGMRLALLIQEAENLSNEVHKKGRKYGIIEALNVCRSGTTDNVNLLYVEYLGRGGKEAAKGITVVDNQERLQQFVQNHYAVFVSKILSGEEGRFFEQVTGKAGGGNQASHQAIYIKNMLSLSVGNHLWKPEFDLYTRLLLDKLFSYSQERLIKVFFRYHLIEKFVVYIADKMMDIYEPLSEQLEKLRLPLAECFEEREEDRYVLKLQAAYQVLIALGFLELEGRVAKRKQGEEESVKRVRLRLSPDVT